MLKRETSYKREVERLEKKNSLKISDDNVPSQQILEEATMEVDTATAPLAEQSVVTMPVPQVSMVACRAPSQVGKKPILPGGRKEVAAASSKPAATSNGKGSKKVKDAGLNQQKGVTPKGAGKSKLPPPISVYNANVKALNDLVISKLGHDKFTISLVNRKISNFQVLTLEEHQSVRELLVEQGINFYTFTPKGQSIYSVVIEKLPDSYDVKDVEAGLKALPIYLEVKRVVKLGGNKRLVHLDKGSDINGLYKVKRVVKLGGNKRLVHLDKGSDINGLYKVKRLFTNGIVVRKDKKKGLTQCHNCQRHFHVSTNCGMPYCCVKCAGDHGPGKCKIPKGVNKPTMIPVTDPVTGKVTMRPDYVFKCVNCNRTGHAANARDCPTRLKLLAKAAEGKVAKAVETVPKASFPKDSGKIQPNVSFASATSAKAAPKANLTLGQQPKANVVTAQPKANTTLGLPKANMALGEQSLDKVVSGFTLFDELCNEIFGKDFLTSVMQVRQFSEELKSKDKASQAKAMVSLVGMLGING
uniref:Peptidase n=1 Tax=Musca domestica TaxID=7370 RepID=T1PD46_MUSDO